MIYGAVLPINDDTFKKGRYLFELVVQHPPHPSTGSAF